MHRIGLLIPGLAVLSMWTVPAQAALTIKIEEVRSNVKASFSGSFNNQALSFESSLSATNGLDIGQSPTFRGLFASSGSFEAFGIPFKQNEPSNPFGAIVRPFDSISNASPIGFAYFGNTASVIVPQSSQPGNFGSSTVGMWDNTTIGALGLTEGSFTWSWGEGALASSLTMEIGSVGSAIPEPSSLTFLMFGAVGMGGSGLVRRLRQSDNG